MIDSTVVRAHQHVSGQKNDPASECLGQSVGGWSTKIHAAVDALGNPLRITLTVGQRADITQAEKLIAGYDRADFYGLCQRERIIFVIFFTPGNHRINSVDEFIAIGSPKRLRLRPAFCSCPP